MNFEKLKPVIIIGGGGHARVLIAAVKKAEREIIGIIDPALPVNSEVCGVKVLGGDEALANYNSLKIELINGIGTIGDVSLRQKIFLQQKQKGFTFATVIDPQALISEGVTLAEGAQVLLGAKLQPGVFVGENSILNTGCIVDHDCQIGAHCHIAPGVVFSGSVQVGDRTHVGTGAVVIQSVKIGNDVMIGAGTVIRKAVQDGFKVYPANNLAVLPKKS